MRKAPFRRPAAASSVRRALFARSFASWPLALASRRRPSCPFPASGGERVPKTDMVAAVREGA
eukprot:5276346-Lingulodinium_polyedra.AAC.1